MFTRGLRKHGSTLHSWGKPQDVYCSVCLGSVLERMSIFEPLEDLGERDQAGAVFLLQVKGAYLAQRGSGAYGEAWSGSWLGLGRN